MQRFCTSPSLCLTSKNRPGFGLYLPIGRQFDPHFNLPQHRHNGHDVAGHHIASLLLIFRLAGIILRRGFVISYDDAIKAAEGRIICEVAEQGEA